MNKIERENEKAKILEHLVQSVLILNEKVDLLMAKAKVKLTEEEGNK